MVEPVSYTHLGSILYFLCATREIFRKYRLVRKKQIQTRIINQMKKRIAPDLIPMIFWKFYL